MSFDVYMDFKLGDKKLSDFGGTLHNGGGDFVKINILPSMAKDIEEIPLVDGNIFYGAKYEPRILDLNIIIENETFNEDMFTNWLKSKTPQWFNYIGSNKKIRVVYDDVVDMEVYNRYQSLITLRLIAYNPYWSLIDDIVFTKVSPAFNISYDIINGGNTESYPLIKISCETTQTITFELNGVQYKLSNVVNETYIDFNNCTVYTINGSVKNNRIANYECLNGKYKYQFDFLKVGNNSIKVISGIVNSITVNCNSRFI